MRLYRIFVFTLICVFLSACVSSLLIGNKVQSRLMWAFLKPIVGFDPNEVKFFETPMVKNRMTKLLGNKYEPTMKLLRTAQEIQQEGALFYVISRYAPPKVQAITDKAGMVWNADTNQMAVVLIQDGVPEVFSEQIENAKQTITPVLPAELKNAYENAVEKKKQIDEFKEKLENTQDLIQTLPESVQQQVEQNIENRENQLKPDLIDQAEKNQQLDK